MALCETMYPFMPYDIQFGIHYRVIHVMYEYVNYKCNSITVFFFFKFSQRQPPEANL